MCTSHFARLATLPARTGCHRTFRSLVPSSSEQETFSTMVGACCLRTLSERDATEPESFSLPFKQQDCISRSNPLRVDQFEAGVQFGDLCSTSKASRGRELHGDAAVRKSRARFHPRRRLRGNNRRSSLAPKPKTRGTATSFLGSGLGGSSVRILGSDAQVCVWRGQLPGSLQPELPSLG